MRFAKLLVLPLALLFLALPAVSQGSGGVFSSGYALGLRVGTPGVGLELTKRISNQFNARLGYNMFSYSFEDEVPENDYRYEADANISTMNILADWHPGGGGFRVSAGGFLNLNTIDATAFPIKTYNIGGLTYTPEDLGQVDVDVEFDTFAPYIGIGFGNPVAQGKKWGFVTDLGVFYQNSGKVTMKATEMLQPTEDQASDVEDDLSGWTAYIVLSLGLTFQMF